MKMQDIAAINTRDVLGGTASLMNQASLNTAAIQLEAQKNKFDLSKQIEDTSRWQGELDRSRIRDDWVWGHHGHKGYGHGHHDGHHDGHHGGHHDGHHRRATHIHNNLYNRQDQSISPPRRRGRRSGPPGSDSGNESS